MASKLSGKVLFLHGFVQSGDIFKAKTSGVRKALKKIGLESYYLTAPIDIVPADLPFDLSESDLLSKYGADTNKREFRGWWLKNDKDYNIDLALECIKSFAQLEGPFVGIIGFSQGAGLAGLITQNFHTLIPENPPLKFSIFYSGFKITDNDSLQKYYEPKISIPTLHILGELDTVVSMERSMKLYDECCIEGTATLLKHPGGHFVPNARPILDQELAWIRHAMEEPKIEKSVDEPKLEAKDDDLDDILAMIDNLGKA